MGRIPRCLPDEYIAEFGSTIGRGTTAGCREAAIVWLLAACGVRGVQIRRLRLDHLDWQKLRSLYTANTLSAPLLLPGDRDGRLA